MTVNTGAGIVQAAHEDAGVCSVGQLVTTAQQNRGLERLNDLIDFHATQGLKLWLNRTIPVTLVATQATYRLGPGGDVNMTKPLQVLEGYYLTSTADRTPLNLMARADYLRLSNTTTPGAINSFCPDKQATYIDVSFWNTPDAQAATGSVLLLARVSAPNLVVAADNVQFPPEWTLFLRWALADELATGQSQATQDRCAGRATFYKEAVEGFDVEEASVQFQPDPRSQMFTGRFR